MYAKNFNSSLVWATGQHALLECIYQNFDSVIGLGNRATCWSRLCMPTILSRHCSGQQGNRQLSTVYAKIFNWSLVWATGQQGGFERVCQNFEFVVANCCQPLPDVANCFQILLNTAMLLSRHLMAKRRCHRSGQ